MNRRPAPSRARVLGVALAALIAFPACSGGSDPSAPKVAVRIMPLGDSITEPPSPDSSYRYSLWKELDELGYCIDFVGSMSGVHGGDPAHTDFDQDHEGHFGWQADQVLVRTLEWAEAARPDIVLMHLGTNDVINLQSPAGIAEELGQIIDALREVNPEVIVLVAQLIPAQTGHGADVAPLNAEIPNMVAARNRAESPLFVVNQFDGFDALADTHDGVHPNQAGEVKMAERWLEVLAPLLTVTGGCGPGLPLCAGDGAVAPCPGGDPAEPGSLQGCRNSTGVGALLLARHETGGAGPGLELEVQHAAPLQPGFFLEAFAESGPAPLGGGLSCLGSRVSPLGALATDATGAARIHLAAGERGRRPGDQALYQYWYRDGGASNLSSGLLLQWD